MKGIKVLLGAFAMTMASSAFAAITFDFTENNGDTLGSLSFSSGGYDLEAYASNNKEADGNYSAIGSGSYGLTVTNYRYGRYGYYRDDNTHQIDGSGPDETVTLDFLGEVVKLISATFSFVGSNDDFNLLVNGTQIFADRDPGNSFVSTYNFANLPQYVGSSFGFLADHRSDDFKLKSVTVAYVPEPASITLLGLGLIALAFIRRRKVQF